MTRPAVSVLMSVYNGGKYITQSLDSLLRQTFRDFELIVIDDASTDDTAGILRQYAQKDSRIVVQRNERNLKLAASLNRGLPLCHAPLVARADADDWYIADRLKKQWAAMQESPKIGALSSAYHVTDEKGTHLDTICLPNRDEEIRLHLLWESALCHAASVYSRSLVMEVGGYDENYWTAQDYDLWARIQAKTRFCNLKEPLMFVRGNPRSISATKGIAGREKAAVVSQRLLAAFLGRPIRFEQAVSFRDLMCADAPLEDGQYREGVCVIGEVADKCKETGSPPTTAWLRRRVSESLLKHALLLTYHRPVTGWRLLMRGLRVDFTQAGAASTWKQFARYLLMVPLKRLQVGAGGAKASVSTFNPPQPSNRFPSGKG